MKRSLLVILLCLLTGCAGDQGFPDGAAASQRPAPVEGTDVTFFVAADAHLGAEGMEELNRRMIDHINRLPGTEYPAAIGGRVDRPRGVLFAGDTTDHGLPGEWKTFKQLYGLTGKEGLLRWPIFEGTGNHDRFLPLPEPVLWGVRQRHGGLRYSWNWDDLHLVCLDLYPSPGNIRWLRRDLAAVGTDTPVVIYFHYSILGPYSDFWKDREKAAFAEAIRPYNAIGIFHGHYHGSYAYQWEGKPVFDIGSPRHATHRFLAVRVTDAAMTVAAWDWDLGQWDWSVRVPIKASRDTGDEQ